jgi:prolipoprotein diacylglyceryl transferase
MLNYITWDLSPEIFSLGPITVRYYGLLWASSFMISYIIMKKIFLREGLTEEQLDKFSMYIFAGTILGARLGHVLFYQPGYYLHNPIEILQIWKGGLASHGGAFGILVAMYLATKFLKKTYLWIADRIVIVVALSGFLIRMGNLMNSEIYGIQTHLPWGFIFVLNNETVPKHPTQIYEGIIALMVFIYLMYAYFKTTIFKKEGFAFGLFMFVIFIDRLLIEFIKEKQVAFEYNMPLDMGQILSIPFILAGAYLIFRTLKQKNTTTN